MTAELSPAERFAASRKKRRFPLLDAMRALATLRNAAA